jgi:hypothetical protein
MGANMEETEAQEILDLISKTGEPEKASEAYRSLPLEVRSRLIEALKGVRTEEGGRFLNLAQASEEDRDLKKEMKKLLFRLRTSGVPVAEPEEAGEPVLRRYAEERRHRGYLSNYDGEGTRIVIVVLEVKRNSFLFVHGITHLYEGLRELATAVLTNKDVGAVFDEYARTTRRPFILTDISARYAAFLIEEEGALSGKFREEVRQVKEFAGPLKDPVARPPDLYGLEAPEGTESLPFEEVLTDEVFEPFTFTWEGIETDRKEFERLGTSTIVLPPYLVAEKRTQFVSQLVQSERLKSPLERLHRLMEDYALMLFSLERFSAFRGLIDTLRNPESLSEALSVLVRRPLEAEPEEGVNPGLIVNPYEPVRR